MFWEIFDDAETIILLRNVISEQELRAALERTDAILRVQYDKATQKTKNTDEYQEALWAMADTTSDRRQLQEIYDSSYSRIMAKRVGRAVRPKETFNQRLISLRKEGHGRIIVGHGSGWFSFRENIMRGYVRLQAEEKGISLGREN